MSRRTILLLRHPQTVKAAGKRFIGQYDVELSTEGLENCSRLGLMLKRKEWNHLFSGTLKRSRVTAEIIGSHIGLEAEHEEGLNEISLGTWEGRLIEEIKKEFPAEYMERGRRLTMYRTPGGENLSDLRKRVLPAFSRILQNQGNLVIVGHRSVNRVILGEIMGITEDKTLNIMQDYGACNILIQDGSDFIIERINGGSDL